jgi:pimeloyl-ACP methyl ester carboxylesterase
MPSPSTTVPPVARTHEIASPDGASLFVRDWGPVDGTPIVHHHGMPGCSLSVPGGWDAAKQVGVRVISIDRPGYGRSARRPGRRVADAAEWTGRVADALDLDRFSLFGMGAGAAHAAAAAAALGERVRKLCLAAALGPDELPGFDPANEMIAMTRHEIACARAGESVLRTFLEPLMALTEPLEPWLEDLPACDVEVLGRREVQVEDAASYEESMASGLDGWVDDDLALFHREWGCDFAAVTSRTLLLYGLDDVLVPANHGDAWRLVLGHGQLVKVPEAGHWLRDFEPEVLDWLASPADEPARLTM